MNKTHIGSNFDDFLDEEGIFAEAMVIKRVIAFQVEQTMIEQNFFRTKMSRRIEISRALI